MSKRLLPILVALFLLIFIPLLSSSKVRLAYYRLKDPAIQWLKEEIYQINHNDTEREVRIVCLGDSMTDDIPKQPIINRLFVLRPNWTQMAENMLRDAFPDQRVLVFNHGVRSRGISTALERMEVSYQAFDNYHKRPIVLPPVKEINPHIIILESHAYMDRNTDYSEYAEIVKKIVALATEKFGAEVFFLATICPDSKDFRKHHSKYVNNPQRREREAQLVCKRLEEFIQMGQEMGIAVIDVYHKSSTNPRVYIKQDMVHPSYRGHMLIAEGVFNKIRESSVFASSKERHSAITWNLRSEEGY